MMRHREARRCYRPVQASGESADNDPRSLGEDLMRLLAIVLIAVSAVTAGPAVGGTYPERNVRLIVPYPPGGNVDTAARIVATSCSSGWASRLLSTTRPARAA